MNKIVWIMYLGDLVDGLSAWFKLIGCIGMFLIIIPTGIWVCTNDQGYEFTEYDKICLQRIKIIAIVGSIVGPLFFLFSAILPTSTTIYAYAGVEATKAALETQIGKQLPEISNKTLLLINQKLDKYLSEGK